MPDHYLPYAINSNILEFINISLNGNFGEHKKALDAKGE